MLHARERAHSLDSLELMAKFKSYSNIADADLASITKFYDCFLMSNFRGHLHRYLLVLWIPHNKSKLGMQSKRVMISSGEDKGEQIEISTSV